MNRDTADIERQKRVNRVVALRAAGVHYTRIAEQLDIDVSQVYIDIRHAVDAARQRNVTLVEEMFLVHQDRLEELFRLVQEKISSAEVFDDKLFKTAIMILDRQSRLLGLDKDKRAGGGEQGRYDWMETATPEQLVDEARRLGVKVPEAFDVPKPLGSEQLFVEAESVRRKLRGADDRRGDEGGVRPDATPGRPPDDRP